MRTLRGRYSGLCQPTYVLDLPGGYGKSPIGPAYAADPWGRPSSTMKAGRIATPRSTRGGLPCRPNSWHERGRRRRGRRCLCGRQSDAQRPGTLCVVAATLTAVPVLAQDGATPLGPEDVKRELVGKVWQVELPNGVPGGGDLSRGRHGQDHRRAQRPGLLAPLGAGLLHAVVPDAQGAPSAASRSTGPPTARSGSSSPTARSR